MNTSERINQSTGSSSKGRPGPSNFVDLTRSSGQEESSTTILKRRVTTLEIENSNLYNDNELIKSQLSQNEQKVSNLEKQMQLLKNDNLDLRNLLNEMKEEFRNLNKAITGEFLDLKKEGLMNKRSIQKMKKVSSFRKEVIRHNAIPDSALLYKHAQSTPAAYPAYDEEEKLDDHSPINDHPNSSFISGKGGDGFGSVISEAKFYDQQMGYSFISEMEPMSSVNLHAVNPFFFNPTLKDKGVQNESVLEDITEVKEPYMLSSAESRRADLRAEFRASLRKSIQDSGKMFEVQKPFENFVVIGVTQEDAAEHLKLLKDKNIKSAKKVDGESQNSRIEGKVLFNYAESANLPEKTFLPDLERFVTSGLLSLTEIPQKNKQEIDDYICKVILQKNKPKCRYICPFQPHVTEIQLTKWSKDGETFNPQNKLYAVCVKKPDFLIVKDKKNQERFVCVDTVYLFLTYSPVVPLIFDMLFSVLNLIRLKRKQRYFVEDKVDMDILKTLLPNEVSAYLASLIEIPAPVPGNTIEYMYYNDSDKHLDKLHYTFTHQEEGYLELATWKAKLTFARFSLDDIKLIVSAMLLEKSIVFFSSDIMLLTAILNTFLGLLAPFKYVCTIIPALPSSLVQMCGAPVPTIIGINRNQEYFWRKEIQEFTDNIFVFIDSSVIYIDHENTDASSFPKLDFLTNDLDQIYDELNPDPSGFRRVDDLNTLKNKLGKVNERVGKKTIGALNKKEEKKSYKNMKSKNKENIKFLFKTFKERLRENIAQYLPDLSAYSSASEEELNEKIEILIQDYKIKKFFHAYKLTQGFSSYPYSLSE